MAFREFEVTPQAVEQARKAGVCGDVAKRVARMARRAAPLTSNLGNRRFDEYALMIRDGKVLDVQRLPSDAL